MTIERTIIQPAAERSEIEEALQIEQQRHWRIETSLSAEFKIENVRFVHDPHWREGFFSITGVADVAAFRYERVTPRVVFWHSVQFFFYAAQFAWVAGAGAVAVLYTHDAFVWFVIMIFGLLIALSACLPKIEGWLFWWRFDRASRKVIHRKV